MATGRFTQRDPWSGDQERPQTLNVYEYVENNPVNWIDSSGLSRLMVVRGADADDPGGLAIRYSPSRNAKIFKRIHDGTRVETFEDVPVQGFSADSGTWYSLTRVSIGASDEWNWPMFGLPWLWASSRYLVDVAGPSAPPMPAPASEGSLSHLPLDEPIKFWNGYGYYDWGGPNAQSTCGLEKGSVVCGCETYQKPELSYEGYGCNLCFHNGWDMTSSSSTNVYAMGDGKIVAGGDANRLHVSHTVNNVTIEVQYTHINAAQFTKSVNDTVTAGEILGQYGTYGTGFAHLHLTVKVGGKVVNPKDYWPGGAPASFTGSWGNPICVPPGCP